MMQNPVERVQAALDAQGLDIQVKTFQVSTSTAQNAAKAVGCNQGAIVKSLCFIVAGQPVLVLAAGDRRVNSKALRQILGASKRQVKIADADSVQRVTGFTVGGVSPIGHPEPLMTLIDASLSRFEIVHAAAGSANSIFSIPYETLVKITHGHVHNLTID
ncbi:MAG: YbaK/EbsC family protein [Anaerolineae bacterium]|nr:YbaK/EbsC family protein [Anaerolineae bacterium]